MSTTTDKNINKLIDTIHELKTEVKNLKNRVNHIVDELHVTKDTISVFKKNVAEDVTYLTERIDGGRV